MHNPHPFAALLGLFLIGSSSLLQVQAAPQDEQLKPHGQEQHAPTGQPQAQKKSQPTQPNPGQAPQHSAAKPQAQSTQRNGPPKDFSTVHQAFHERRGQIGVGPSLPKGLTIAKGKPLPQGYGKPLDSRALQGLPRYEGYEWRRVGSDVVLVTVATGIVYTILQGVLN